MTETGAKNTTEQGRRSRSTDILENTFAADDALPSTGLHLFSRLEDITSRRSLNEWLRASDAFGGLYLYNCECSYPVDSYLNELFKYERVCVNKRNKGTRILYMSVLRLMMPIDLPQRLYREFGERVASRMLIGSQGVVPYFMRTMKRGKCTYLLLFFSERYFYPDGRVMEITASSDFYRNPVTGQRCSADCEGAVLAMKKGDVIRTTVSKFSIKERITRVDHHTTKRQRKRLKWLMKQYFTEHLAPQSNDALFARLSHDTAAPMLKAKCCEYNTYLQRMETKCTELLDALKGSGFDDALSDVHDFIKHWRKQALVSEGSIRINNHSFKYTINFKSTLENFHEALEAMFFNFEQAFNRLVATVFPSFV